MVELNERLIKLSIYNDIDKAALARNKAIFGKFDIYGKMLAYDYELIIDEACVAVSSILTGKNQ